MDKTVKEVLAAVLIGFCIVAITLCIIVVTNSPAVTTRFPATIEKVMPSVVHVMCGRWQGSGVAITKDILMTARHVGKDGERFLITMSDGKTVSGSQRIYHKEYDVAFIKVDEPVLSPAKFGSIKDCELGEPIFIIGSPYGKINFNNITLGIISGLDKDWEGLSRYGDSYGWEIAFTSDSGAHPGNSGGPVFSMDGVVRGLLVGGFSPVLNCSMPCDLFLKDLENIEVMFILDNYQVDKSGHQGPLDGYGRPIEIERCDYAD